MNIRVKDKCDYSIDSSSRYIPSIERELIAVSLEKDLIGLDQVGELLSTIDRMWQKYKAVGFSYGNFLEIEAMGLGKVINYLKNGGVRDVHQLIDQIEGSLRTYFIDPPLPYYESGTFALVDGSVRRPDKLTKSERIKAILG